MNEMFDRYLKTLARTERASPQELLAYQRALIEALVIHARDHVPYYRDRLACLFGVDGAIDLSRWSEVPILTRQDAVAHFAEIRAPQLPEQFGAIQEFWTSGTSGSPLNFTVNAVARVAYNAAMTRLVLWYDADLAQPMAQIRVFRQGEPATYPDGKSWKGWSRACPDAYTHGLDLRTPARQQVEWLIRKGCHYLTTSPSNAMAIAYAATPAQARELGLKLIFSIGETVIPGARELIAERLGARLVGIYSSEEVGIIATECPEAPHYHVTAENTLVEIVDENAQPVAPGESGRVLVTGLYNYATPFIRYDIGDVAIPSDVPCPCGRSLPVITQIIGRTRNAFIFKDGTRAWPRVWDARAMQALVPCREFQIVQTGYETIEFRYVPDGSERAADLAGLNAYAREHLHPSVEVATVETTTLTRSPGGKHEPFISLIALT
jgi:phenylacetate-CoA ligase